jgi:hypothetical protein
VCAGSSDQLCGYVSQQQQKTDAPCLRCPGVEEEVQFSRASGSVLYDMVPMVQGTGVMSTQDESRVLTWEWMGTGDMD